MLPTGIICLWYGSLGTVPADWIVCDSNGGSPDLRGLFIRGATAGIPPGSTGGSGTHTHDFTGDGHTHSLPGGVIIATGTDVADVTNSSPATGTTDTGSSIPPHHRLYWIMKT